MGKALIHNIFLKTPAPLWDVIDDRSPKIAQYVGVFVKLIV